MSFPGRTNFPHATHTHALELRQCSAEVLRVKMTMMQALALGSDTQRCSMGPWSTELRPGRGRSPKPPAPASVSPACTNPSWLSKAWPLCHHSQWHCLAVPRIRPPRLEQAAAPCTAAGAHH